MQFWCICGECDTRKFRIFDDYKMQSPTHKAPRLRVSLHQTFAMISFDVYRIVGLQTQKQLQTAQTQDMSPYPTKKKSKSFKVRFSRMTTTLKWTQWI